MQLLFTCTIPFVFQLRVTFQVFPISSFLRQRWFHNSRKPLGFCLFSIAGEWSCNLLWSLAWFWTYDNRNSSFLVFSTECQWWVDCKWVEWVRYVLDVRNTTGPHGHRFDRLRFYRLVQRPWPGHRDHSYWAVWCSYHRLWDCRFNRLIFF